MLSVTLARQVAIVSCCRTILQANEPFCNDITTS